MRQELERIYEKHRQGLYTLALSITRHPSSAEDAVHEAFCRLYKLQVPPLHDKTAYVFAAVRNAAIDQNRRQKPTVQSELAISMFDCGEASPDAKAITAEQESLVRQAMDKLTDEQRHTVVMKVYGGLTFDQIAQTLGEPLPTVAARYRRALEKLKEVLSRKIGATYE